MTIDVMHREDKRKDLLEFLPVDMRKSLLQCLSACERIDPLRRAELLEGLSLAEKERIASNIAQQVLTDGTAIPLCTVLYEGNLQTISMILGLTLNRRRHNTHFGIGLDGSDDVKAAVITELTSLITRLHKSTGTEDFDIMVEIAKETVVFVGSIDKDNMNERLALAINKLTETIDQVFHTSLLELMATLSSCLRPETAATITT